MNRGRTWTVSALDQAVNIVVTGNHGGKHRRLTLIEIGALRTCVEPWLKPAPGGTALVAAFRLDYALEAGAWAKILGWLRKAEMVADGTDAGLSDITGLTISAPGEGPIRHHCVRPTERFHAVMAENGLTRIEFVGTNSEPREMNTKTPSDPVRIDLFDVRQSVRRAEMPESGLMFTAIDNTSIQLRFHDEPLCMVACGDDFARCCLVLRGAVATAAAAGCVAAWRRAQELATADSEALLKEVGELFRRTGGEILRLIDQAQVGG